MCTVTWTRTSGGYHLFMNRDELWTRGVAEGPALREGGAVRYLAPIDSDAGGTWIGVNAYGVTLCLLNHYPEAGEPMVRTTGGGSPATVRGAPADGAAATARAPTTKAPTAGEGAAKERAATAGAAGSRSRGHLIPSLAGVRSCGGATAALGMADLSQYRPFLLLVIAPRCGPTLHRWNELDLRVIRDVEPPVTTSSFDSEAVLSRRIETYDVLVSPSSRHGATGQPGGTEAAGISPAALLRYHGSHRPDRGPYSVCTHRNDGGTRSLSRVTVTDELVHFHYAPGPPCETDPVLAASLSRVS